jgi:hypothetical protein
VLAVVPLVLSPLVVNVEHHLLSDTLFLALFGAAALLPAWSQRRPGLRACALAGLAVACAIVTRQVALVLVPVLLAYLLLRRTGWVGIGAFALAVALPVLGYLAWMHATYGVYDFSTWSGKVLYARVAPIARCDRLGPLTAQQRQLCDPRAPGRRPGPSGYLWTHGRGPQRHLPDAVMLSFARRVIARQPVDYARMVASETAQVFYPGRRQRPGQACVAYWSFPGPRPGGCRTDAVGTRIWREHPFTVRRRLARFLQAYQRLDYAAGPALLASLLVTVLAVAWRPRAGGWRLRLDAALLALAGLVLTAAAVATAMFSYRYTLPLYGTAPPAAALALRQLLRAGRRAGRAEAAA